MPAMSVATRPSARVALFKLCLGKDITVSLPNPHASQKHLSNVIGVSDRFTKDARLSATHLICLQRSEVQMIHFLINNLSN